MKNIVLWFLKKIDPKYVEETEKINHRLSFHSVYLPTPIELDYQSLGDMVTNAARYKNAGDIDSAHVQLRAVKDKIDLMMMK